MILLKNFWTFTLKVNLLLVFLFISNVAWSIENISCVIEPKQMIKLNTAVNGVIESVEVQRGDFVKKGQIIAHLESAVEKSSVELAQIRAKNTFDIAATRSSIKLLKSKLSRLTKMNQANKYTSDAEIEEVSTELIIAKHQLNEDFHQHKIAELELAYSEAVLEQRIIRSPIDGVVVEKLMSPGEYRNEDTHIVTIAQIDPLNVEVFVPSFLHHSVVVGDEFKIKPEEPFKGEYLAKVTVVDQVFDAASGTFGMRLNLPNPEYKIPAGIKCIMHIEKNVSNTSIH